MNFDDRLATVISTAPIDARDRAVRWRQLVDLVARAGPDARGVQIETALAIIRAGRGDVSEMARAAAARAITGRPLSRSLLEAFAADTLTVAAPLLTDPHSAAEVREGASEEVRRFIDAMHGTSVPQRADKPIFDPQPAVAPPPPLNGSVPTIDEVVARIEQLRVSREHGADLAASPMVETLQPPASPPIVVPSPTPAPTLAAETSSPALFRWECGPGGEIGWVEGAPRGAIIGRSIARAVPGDGVDEHVERAFGRRSPFRDAVLALPDGGTIEGRWQISGVPAFSPGDGRFVGYRGIARRGDALAPAGLPRVSTDLDPTALRELVHEIKTPLNAIIGFAEIIDGQYLGPAQTGYRARAAEIVNQAQVLLAAIDDLDFAARLQGGHDERGATSDFTSLFDPLAARLAAAAAGRWVTIAVDAPAEVGRSNVDDRIAERLIERFVEAVLAETASGETLRLTARDEGEVVAVRLSRPRALEGMAPDALFATDRNGTSLRLLAGLVRIVGGTVDAERGDLVLRLPSGGAVGPEGFEPPT